MYNDNFVSSKESSLDPDWVVYLSGKGILQTRRKELGFTQQQVADMAKIQLRQYQRFENGERELHSASMRIGLSICAVLKLDPYRFYPKSLLGIDDE